MNDKKIRAVPILCRYCSYTSKSHLAILMSLQPNAVSILAMVCMVKLCLPKLCFLLFWHGCKALSEQSILYH